MELSRCGRIVKDRSVSGRPKVDFEKAMSVCACHGKIERTLDSRPIIEEHRHTSSAAETSLMTSNGSAYQVAVNNLDHSWTFS